MKKWNRKIIINTGEKYDKLISFEEEVISCPQ